MLLFSCVFSQEVNHQCSIEKDKNCSVHLICLPYLLRRPYNMASCCLNSFRRFLASATTAAYSWYSLHLLWHPACRFGHFLSHGGFNIYNASYQKCFYDGNTICSASFSEWATPVIAPAFAMASKNRCWSGRGFSPGNFTSM